MYVFGQILGVILIVAGFFGTPAWVVVSAIKRKRRKAVNVPNLAENFPDLGNPYDRSQG